MFVDADNYPVLVHCIHGKDRTGLIVMLIMLLCSVEPEVSGPEPTWGLTNLHNVTRRLQNIICMCHSTPLFKYKLHK